MNNQRFFQIKLEQYILWSASLAIIEARRQACTRTPRKLHPAKGARQAAGCPALTATSVGTPSIFGHASDTSRSRRWPSQIHFAIQALGGKVRSNKTHSRLRHFAPGRGIVKCCGSAIVFRRHPPRRDPWSSRVELHRRISRRHERVAASRVRSGVAIGLATSRAA